MLKKEIEQLQYEAVDAVSVAGPYDHVALSEPNTVYTVADPTEPPNLLNINRFTVKDSNPTRHIDRNKQVANLKYCDGKIQEEVKKRHSKIENVDLNN